jgi:hypothetical protein
MATETHSGCADAAVACREGEECVDGEGGVFVVCCDCLVVRSVGGEGGVESKWILSTRTGYIVGEEEIGVCGREGIKHKGYLRDLPLITLVGAGNIVCERFWASELVVGGWGCDDVALGGDLAGEAGDGAGYW